jgi:hypothetical protein
VAKKLLALYGTWNDNEAFTKLRHYFL